MKNLVRLFILATLAASCSLDFGSIQGGLLDSGTPGAGGQAGTSALTGGTTSTGGRDSGLGDGGGGSIEVGGVDVSAERPQSDGAADKPAAPDGQPDVSIGGTGGAAGTGGNPGTGGTTSVGGATSTGGAGTGGAGTGGTTTRGGTTSAGGTITAGGTTSAGGTATTGGTTSAGGTTTAGGTIASGGTTGAGGSNPGTGGSTGSPLPCDILNSAGPKCVAAHSTVRVILTGYTGPLYQVCLGTANPGPSSCQGTTQDIQSKDGYADAATQDTFCSGGTCTITKIYDQSGAENDLEPAPGGGTVVTPRNPANAAALPVTSNGHSAYGILIKGGIGYRTGCSGCNIKTGKGMATGDQPQSIYMVTSQKNLVDGCCFDYGNAETDSNDDGNGTEETVYFGAGVVWGTGYGGKPGPWVMADLENGIYAGWDSTKTSGQDQLISTNKPLKFDFVTAILLGDTQDKNSGKGRFALYGADATGADATYGKLATMYDGIRPQKTGYVPMQKQGSLILGTSGDNSDADGGQFYEGAVATGPVASKAALDALQAAIVAAKYGQ